MSQFNAYFCFKLSSNRGSLNNGTKATLIMAKKKKLLMAPKIKIARPWRQWPGR